MASWSKKVYLVLAARGRLGGRIAVGFHPNRVGSGWRPWYMVTVGRLSLLEEPGEVPIGRRIMGDTYMFYVGIYPDVDTAEHDYQAVKDLYYETNLIDTFDAAVVGKKESGNVKIYRNHEQPTRNGGRVGAGWGLATGLVVALFPAAAVGGGLVAGTTAAGAGSGAIAGHVLRGMSRGDLEDLGETLDAGEAALVVAAASDVANMVQASMSQAEKIDSKQVQIDADELETDSKEAQEEATS